MNNITRSFSKFLFALCVLLAGTANAQTNPTAQTLPYSQNFGTATFTTMPTGTAAWNGMNGGSVTTQTLAEATTPSGNATLTGVSTAQTTGGSYGYAASSNGAYYIQTSGNNGNGVNQLATAINTGTATAVTVAYDIRVISSQTAIMGVVLQYRAGTSGSWTTVSGSAVSYNNAPTTNGGDNDTAGDSDSYTFNVTGLTASTVYQFRWATWKGSGTGSGLAIDNVNISAFGVTTNGTIVSGEYGTHTNGNNQQTSGSTVTYMTWDNTNLYVGVSAANRAEAFVLYLDKDPQALVNGGTNANGTNVGFNYDGTSFAALQFRADLVLYVKDNYREYRTADGSNGWSAQTSGFGSYADNGSNVREFSIPWSAIGGRPTSFNWFGYVTSSGGFVYAQVPTENAGGNIGTSARYSRYYTVSTTTVGSSTPPFSRNSFVFNSTTDDNSFGTISVWDFTMNSSGRQISRTGGAAGAWTIGGNLNVGAGNIYLGSGSAANAVNVAGNLNISGGLYSLDTSTSSTTVTGNVNLSGGTLQLSSSVGGDLNLVGNWNYTGGTFTPASRQVSFNGTTAQTLTGANTFDFFRINNTNGLMLNSSITVNSTLTFTAGKITLGSNNLTLGASASTTGQSATAYIATTGTGQLKRTVGASSVFFPVGNAAYNPITLNNTGGTSDVYGINVLDGTIPTANDATRTINRRWQLSEAVAGGSNLTVVAQYNTGEQGTNYNAASNPSVGFYDGSAWAQQAATLAGSNPFTATTSTALTPADATSGTQYFAVGKDTGLAVQAATKFVITAITPSTPTAGQTFNVTVQAQNASGVPTNVTQDTDFYFDTNGLAGDLMGGTQSDAIASGQNTKVVTGVLLPTAATGVTITAIGFSGDPLTDGVSAPFEVGAPASQLAFVSFPSSGTVGSAVTSFTVEARRPNGSIDTSYNEDIVLTKATGPGGVSGTLTVAASAGVATFSTVQFGAAGSYTLYANSTGLSQATSSSITITVVPVAIAAWDFNPLTGGTNNFGTSPLAATTADSNLTAGGLTRGTGIGTTGTGAGDAWGGNDIQETSFANAVSGNDFATFTLTPSTGYQMSLDNIGAYNIRRSTSGPTTGQWQYRVNSGSYINIGSTITWGGVTSAAGNPQTAISLSGISDLQNVAPGTTITFRIVTWGGTNSTGTWYLNDPLQTSANDFVINGNVLCVSPNTFNVTGGGAYCSSNPSGVAIGLDGSQVGLSYQLKRNGTNVDSPVAGTGSAISFLNQTVAGTYTVEAYNPTGSCSGLNLTMTGSVAVSVDAAPTAGSISGGGGTVCAGTNSTGLTLSGHSGSIQWQSSPDNSTFTNISGETSATYTATNLTATTYFRAVVSSGVCTPVNTASVVVNVDPVSVAGNIGGATTVCTGTNSTGLTLTGHTGSIQWQSSPDNSAFTNISGETGTTYTATNLTATTYYRVVVTSGVCSAATSGSVAVMVSPASVAGTISGGGGTVCSGTNSTGLTLSGHTGTIQWQSSPDNSAFTDISGETGTTYTATNLTATTYYRAVVTSSPCSSATTASFAVNVTSAVAGTISGGGTFCGGGTATLTLTGNTGSIQWQSSPDNSSFTNISGETSATYNATISGTMYYRVVVTSGPCTDTSASVSVAAGTATTWNGTAWSNGDPTSSSVVTFAGNFTATADLNACSITVSSGAIVIPSGFDVSLNGALTVTGGSFTLENNANLLQATTASNSGNIIVKRNSSAIRRQDYTLWSSPVASQGLLAFSPLTVTSPTSRFYEYNPSTNQYNSITTPGSVNFAGAKGYLIRVANNHPTFPWVWNGQFNGVPHNGNYGYTLYNGGNGNRFNLVGNPYPSPISAASFVSANSSEITGTLYFWRETNGNLNNNPYCTWSPAGGGTFVTNGESSVIDPQGIIQTGQGFFVEASATGSAVSFTNAMRVGNNANQFFRPAGAASVATENAKVWINVTSDAGAFCQTAVVYTEEATNGYEEGVDARSILTANTGLYSQVDGQRLGIQGRALPFDVTDVVPLVFNTNTAGTYSIAIDHVDGLFTAGQNIYLKDNALGTQHLLNSGAYSFTTETGEFASRFEIVYQAALGTVNPTLDGSVNIIKTNGAFVINSGVTTMDNVKVFDIRGRLLAELNDVNATQATFTVGEANQVLIVKITGVDGQTATRKVMN